MARYYFADNNNPGDKLNDEFADSKFTIDKYSSFAREVIQNSIDAKDKNVDEPVIVEFNLSSFALDDIPGAKEVKETLNYCIDYTTQPKTVEIYKEGLRLLSEEKIFCLKVSDYNTVGVKSGRDEAWGALVFDVGKSVKARSDSLGNHGVGKKVPFIISGVNTVFYATKNATDELLIGKSVLTDFKDKNGDRKIHEGWYGVVDENLEIRERVTAINTEIDDSINPYFVRKNDKGTDVIIVAIDAKSKELEIEKNIINAVLESFFVAIKKNLLIVKISGFEDKEIIINDDSFDTVFNDYYVGNDFFKRINSTFVVGNLFDYVNTYDNAEPELLSVQNETGEDIGVIKLYLSLNNTKGKKYYSIIRSHGMKICDCSFGADQPYTCIAFIEGEKLNTALASLENPAHDDFLTGEAYCTPENVEIYKSVIRKIQNRITEFTKIEAEKEQNISGLEDMIDLSGLLPKLAEKKTNKRKIEIRPPRPHPIPNPEPPEPPEPEPNPPLPVPPPEPKPLENKNRILDAFLMEPFCYMNKDEYIIRFSLIRDIDKASISVVAIDADNKENSSISGIIKSVKIDGFPLKHLSAGFVSNCKFEKEKVYTVRIKISGKSIYRLGLCLYEKKGGK